MAVLENLRIRVSADLNEAFGECCDRKKISKQDAVDALVKFLLSQDDLSQSVILGQVQSTQEIMALIYAKIAPGTTDIEWSAKGVKLRKKGEKP